MLKMIRLAALAAVLLFAATGVVVPQVVQAQPPTPAAEPAQPAPAAMPAAPAAPAGATKTTEVVDNPYGLEALLKGGDLVARIHETADVLASSHTADGTVLHARVDPALAAALEPYRTGAGVA